MSNKLGRRELLKLYLWTLSYFKPVIPYTVLYVISGGMLIFGELMIPRRMGYIIDNVIPLEDIGKLVYQLMFLCLIIVIILIAKSIFNFLEVIISTKIIKNQQTDLMLKLQALGFSYYEKVPTGNILSIFENSVKEVQRTYTFLFSHFIYSLAQFVVPSVILITGEPMFFLAAMVGNIIYVIVNKFANDKIHYYLGLETESAKVYQQSLYDTITSTLEIKVSGSGDWLINKTIDDHNNYRKPRMRSIFWRHFRFTTVGATLTISIILFYFFGLDMIKSGELLLGEFIGYSFLMSIVSRGFSVFFYIIPAQYHALNYAKDLYDFMGLKPDVKYIEPLQEVIADDYDIDFESVCFSYPTGKSILEDISLKIPFGKKVAIVGESGCGKSTMLKLIGRFYDVSKGKIKVGGHDIKNIKEDNLRNNIGYVFQDTYLFNISIMDNIRFGKPNATENDIFEAAKKANAHQFILETENGYHTILGERGIKLSGGQRQRISLAKLFLNNPKILILDEATSALDLATENSIKKSLEENFTNRTIVAVAHRLSTIKDYDLIVVLDKGKIVESGSYNELMNMKSYFYRLQNRGVVNES